MVKKKKKDKSNTVSIPVDLFKEIESRVKDGPFDSVSEYVEYVLEEVLSEEEIIQEKD